MMAALAAVRDTMKALRAETPPARLAHIASPQLMQQLSRDADCARWARRFLGQDTRQIFTTKER